MVEQSLVKGTLTSFAEAEKNLDKILHGICQRKWEQEVVQKKGKQHATKWVFSQAQDCYFVQPDHTKATMQVDNDFDDEPVSLKAVALAVTSLANRSVNSIPHVGCRAH